MRDYPAEGTLWCGSVDVHSLWVDLSRKFLLIWVVFTEMKHCWEQLERGISASLFSNNITDLGRVGESERDKLSLLQRSHFHSEESDVRMTFRRMMPWRIICRGREEPWPQGLLSAPVTPAPGNVLILMNKSRQSCHRRRAGNCSGRAQTVCGHRWNSCSRCCVQESFPQQQIPGLSHIWSCRKITGCISAPPWTSGIFCCKSHLW